MAIVTAYLLPRVLDLILYAYTFGAAGLFFPMLGLLFWKRATASGAFWSIVAGGTSALLWAVAGEPWVAASYVGWAASAITLVAVSFVTEHSEAKDLHALA